MIASQLAHFLLDEIRNTQMVSYTGADMQARFDPLRGMRLLPSGKMKNAQHLTVEEIVSGILSTITINPTLAGTLALSLSKLRPVGGPSASFRGSNNLQQALSCLIEDSDALESLLAVRISESEIYTNSYGRACIEYIASNGEKKASYYVAGEAYSCMQQGAELKYDPQALIYSTILEKVFYRTFFRSIKTRLDKEKPFLNKPLPIPPEDEDEDKRQKTRAKYLGINNRSRFLNIGVDTHVTWPAAETVVKFEGYKLILFPKTKGNTTSIHLDLNQKNISPEEAQTLINRFLSLLTWCDDHFAVQQGGWSGNPIPVPVQKRNLAFVTTQHWIFDRKYPASSDARRALAIYREGRNAEENFLISYAVLSYYKIVEIRHEGKAASKKWYKDNYTKFLGAAGALPEIQKFEQLCGSEQPHEYLYKACRTAVAHASEKIHSDPDDLDEIRRLHVAARVLRYLARYFIKNELNVSNSLFDGS